VPTVLVEPRWRRREGHVYYTSGAYLFCEDFVGVGAVGAVVEVWVEGLAHHRVKRLQALE
jgi:hypothetical protein